MYLTMEKIITAISKWLQDNLFVWFRIILEEYPGMKWLWIMVGALIIMLVFLKSRRRKNADTPKGGFKNFKGDTWYPDGRILHKDSKTWEQPDYKAENE